MALFGYLMLLACCSAANLALGVIAAGFFGIGPLKGARLVRFLSHPEVAPPHWFHLPRLTHLLGLLSPRWPLRRRQA